MDLTGKIKDINIDLKTNSIVLSLNINESQKAKDMFDDLNQEEKLSISISKYKEKRSLNANAYFHLLVNKIASVTGSSDDEIKKELVVKYGTLYRDETGGVIGFKLPETVNAEKIYPYVRSFDRRIENGKAFICYLCYKRTHTLNTQEMSHLIDGTVSEAKELGIETMTPDELLILKEKWIGAEE